MNPNRTQLRQQRLQLFPDPLGQHFTGRIFQPRDVVQVVVVQALVQRLEDRLDLGEVANPAGVRVEVAAQVDRHFERVAVQAAALVAFRHVGQAVGGFERKFLEDFHSVFSSVRWRSPRRCGQAASLPACPD